MKILVVCPLSPRTGFSGIEEVSLRLAKAYNEAGHNAEIFCCSEDPKNSLIGRVKIREFAFTALGNSSIGKNAFSTALMNGIAKSDAEIVHFNGYNNLALISALLAKKNWQKLVVFANRSGSNSVLRKIGTFFFDLLVNLLSARIDRLVCSSENELRIMKRSLFLLPDTKFSVIRNGVDKAAIMKVRAGKKSDYIISAGRLVEHKGFQHVITGFSAALRKNSGLKLAIIGDGPYRNDLEKLVAKKGIKEKVIFTGTIPFSRREEFLGKIKASRAFIFLSGIEGNPLIVSEAICCGVPVLLYDNGVLHEYVKANNCIPVRNPPDEKEVSEKILLAIDGGKANIPNVSGLKEWQEVAGGFLKLYKTI